MPTWDNLDFTAYRLLNDEYGSRYPVAPRAWFFGTTPGQTTFLHLTRAHLGTDVKGVTGFTPQEARVTGMDKALLTGADGKPVGRWFNGTDTYAAIVPKAVAASLQITPADVGKVTVNFSGVPYLVIGIMDPDKFKAIKDLDNETMTPVDYQAQQSQSSSSSSSSSQSAASQGFQEYLHLDPDAVLYVPYTTLLNLGGSLESVGINMGSGRPSTPSCKT